MVFDASIVDLVTKIVAEVTGPNRGLKRCLWIVEEMPRNRYILDHAFDQLSSSYSIDILPFTPELQDPEGLLYSSYGKLLIWSDFSPQRVAGYDLVVLFNLSLTRVSKIAHLNIDDELTDLIFHFLQTNVSIWMDRWDERYEYKKMRRPLQEKVLSLLEVLEGYGIVQQNFADFACEGGPVDCKELPSTFMGVDEVKLALRQGAQPQELTKSGRLTPLAIDYLNEVARKSRNEVER